MSEILKVNTTLTSLNMSGEKDNKREKRKRKTNSFTDNWIGKGVKSIIETMKVNTTLTSLNLEGD